MEARQESGRVGKGDRRVEGGWREDRRVGGQGGETILKNSGREERGEREVGNS